MTTVVLIICVVLVAVLGYAATRPDSFRLERSTVINAPPEKVFALINSFRAWGDWSPWDKRDPNLKRVFSGPDAGVGCFYGWEGNKQVGSGSMEIVESQNPSKVLLKLDFMKPFEAHNMTEFTLAPQGDGTKVTWVMFGPSPFISKLMSLVFNMEKMVGPDFEKGLATMKALAEKA